MYTSTKKTKILSKDDCRTIAFGILAEHYQHMITIGKSIDLTESTIFAYNIADEIYACFEEFQI